MRCFLIAPLALAAAVATAQSAGTGAIGNLVAPDGKPGGRVMLNQVADGVEVIVEATGIAPGPHGVHFHQGGACAPGPDAAEGKVVSFGAAGPHFDPMHTMNHGHPDDAAHQSHAGELPNLVAGADGRGVLRVVNKKVALSGKTSVLGRTLVVHERPDDYQSDPAGNSGPRILCAVLNPAGPGQVLGRAIFEGSNVFPEGVAVDAQGTAYVGSSTEGHLYRIAPGSDKAELLAMGGSPGRQGAFGIRHDGQGRLWVAGGPNATLAVVDAASGATLAVRRAAPPATPGVPQSFVNDLATARDGNVYLTDSFRPVLWRTKAALDGSTTLEPWLDLARTPIRYVPNEINLNGIVASPDGRWLLAVQSVTGQLWRVDTRTKAVQQVAVEGGELKHGDGLVLDGSTLYVVRNAEREVAKLALDAGWGKARVVQRFQDARLRYPTTAALGANGDLVVVNGQLDAQKGDPPVLPFDVVRIPR